MAFKLDIGTKQGKTYHIETDSNAFIGKQLGERIKGELIDSRLSGYEFLITGASDKQGFPALAFVKGTQVKRILLKRGKGMRKKKPKGLRLRKSVRGNVIADDIVQINLKVVKEGTKSLEELFGKKEKKTSKEKEASKEEKKEGDKK